MESQRKAIVDKYEKNIGKIIKKYEKYEDDYLEVMDILNFDEFPSFCIDSISFIKNNPQKSTIENSSLVLFQDIHKMLCTECSFEDIYWILK